MKTSFELQPRISAMEKKLIHENLNTLENIWNISVDPDTVSISFEYLTGDDLEKVRRELYELGFVIVNDTNRPDTPRKPYWLIPEL